MSEAAVVTSRQLSDSSPSSAGSILIIDDEAEIRESLQTLLELESFAVDTASTGEEGLTRIGQNTYDLVLLDLALPDRDGMDLLADLRTHD